MNAGTGMILEDRLAHLPVRKRRDLFRASVILFEAFPTGNLTDTKNGGRIVRVVLHDSHARGHWVEDRRSGYFSDYDLVDEVDLWDRVRDRIIHVEMLKTFPYATTTIIVPRALSAEVDSGSAQKTR